MELETIVKTTGLEEREFFEIKVRFEKLNKREIDNSK